MSPLAPSGSRGYPDGQRIDNRDTNRLYGHTAQNVHIQENTGVMDVSRYDYIAVRDTVTVGNCSVLITWFADQATTIILGQRKFQMNGIAGDTATWRFMNLGPWVSISWNAFAGVDFTHATSIIASNRTAPIDMQPLLSVVINQVAINVLAGQFDITNASGHYAGPVSLWFAGSVLGVNVALQYLDGTNQWQTFWQFLSTLPNHQFMVVTPSDAWRSVVLAPAGSDVTYWLSVVASMTGGS